jgi:hypothetical protein
MGRAREQTSWEKRVLNALESVGLSMGKRYVFVKKNVQTGAGNDRELFYRKRTFDLATATRLLNLDDPSR